MWLEFKCRKYSGIKYGEVQKGRKEAAPVRKRVGSTGGMIGESVPAAGV